MLPQLKYNVLKHCYKSNRHICLTCSVPLSGDAYKEPFLRIIGRPSHKCTGPGPQKGVGPGLTQRIMQHMTRIVRMTHAIMQQHERPAWPRSWMAASLGRGPGKN